MAGRRVHARMALVLALVSQSHCGAGAIECTDQLVDGLVVSVRDAVTGAPVCDAAVRAQDGAYSTTLATSGPPSTCEYAGAAERPGQYSLTLSAPGYKTSQTSASVAAGQCHVVTAHVDVALEPSTL